LPRQKIFERQNALAFGGAQLTGADKTAEAAISGTVGGIGHDVRRTIGKDQPRPNQELGFGAFDLKPSRISPHHTSQAVAIRNADSGIAKLRRGFHHFAGMGGAA